VKTAQELRAELAELDSKLAEYKTLVNRRADIAQLLDLTERLFGGGTTGPPAGADRPSANVKRLSTHADFLAQALVAGPKDINEILREVRALGWKGSGEDAIDKRRLYVALYRDKARFSLANGRWRLTQGSS
jgi:hypothetical protein